MKKIKITDLLIFIVTAELVGALSALLSGDYKSFYSEYIRPPLMPPAWLFPVVWAVLYALMGISAYIIWNYKGNEIRKATALKLYFLQFAVNFSWSIIFFRFRLLETAAIIAVLLLVLVVMMVISFKRINNTAAWLNVPYIIWLIFASYLAISVYILN